MLHAVIGIGSNSTRMLIGDVVPGKVENKMRLREGTRLFAGLQDGALSTQSMMHTVDAVARLIKTAQEQGVESIHVIATSAARDASNGDELMAMIEAIAGVPMAILSGEEEAKLSFFGATQGARAGVVDIGGGSTEIAAGGANIPLAAGSAQLGAVRLLGEVPVLDGDGFDRALEIAHSRAAAVWGKLEAPIVPAAWFGVGGTLTCLASIDMQLSAFDREAVGGHALGRETVANWAHRLAELTIAQRKELPGMLPERADIIAHGTIVLLGVMEALGIQRIVVSNRTNLDGYLYMLAGSDETLDGVGKVRAFYDASVEGEWTRLERHFAEFYINKRFIDRYVKPGDRVLDVGGGPGRYSLHLAARGAEVTLLDLSEGNVRFAREKAEAEGLPLTAACADARALDTAVDGQYDTVLLMGPLYHLTEESERVQVVEACLRKLKPGGTLFVAFISMLGGMIYAGREAPESILWEGEDVYYNKIVKREDFGGQAFTHAFFVEPSHVLPFMARFPLEMLHLASSEGITAPFQNKLAEQPPEVIDKWLEFAYTLCEREDLLSYAEHFLYIGRKK